MKLKLRKETCVFILLVLLLKCISLERGLQSKLRFSSANIAVYELNKSLFDIQEGYKEKVILQESLVKKILLTFRKERSFLRFTDKELLWTLDTIEELTPVIADIVTEVHKNKTYFVILKEEDKTAPYSRIYRTSFYIHRSEDLLQIVFGEVYNNINFVSQYSFSDWANPIFFKITCKRDRLVVFGGELESAYRFNYDKSCNKDDQMVSQNKKENLTSIENYSWILIDLKKVLEANTDKPKMVTPENNEERLRELLKLYKKGLINKKDYESKKNEILKEL